MLVDRPVLCLCNRSKDSFLQSVSLVQNKNQEKHVHFPRYEQEVAEEIKTLDGEYDKLNDVLTHGAVDGYGKPFLAQ